MHTVLTTPVFRTRGILLIDNCAQELIKSKPLITEIRITETSNILGHGVKMPNEETTPITTGKIKLASRLLFMTYTNADRR